MESKRILLEAESEYRELINFIVRGNYTHIVSVQPHAACLDGWSDRARALAKQLEQVAAAIDSEVAAARKRPPVSS